MDAWKVRSTVSGYVVYHSIITFIILPVGLEFGHLGDGFNVEFTFVFRLEVCLFRCLGPLWCG